MMYLNGNVWIFDVVLIGFCVIQKVNVDSFLIVPGGHDGGEIQSFLH